MRTLLAYFYSKMKQILNSGLLHKMRSSHVLRQKILLTLSYSTVTAKKQDARKNMKKLLKTIAA